MNSAKFYLSKRSNGIYRIGFIQDSKRHWKTTGKHTKAEALSVLKDFEKAFHTPIPARTLTSFKQELLGYLATCSQPGTVSIYNTALSNLISIAGEMNIKELSARDADRYKATRAQCIKHRSKGQTVKPVTINSELRALRAAFNIALKWGLVEANPFALTSLYQIPEAAPIYFGREVFQSFLESISEEWLRRIVVFGALTGMRRGEMIALRWDHVDLQRKVAFLESSEEYKMKAGLRRVVPLSESACFMLGQMQEISREGNVFKREGKVIGKYWLTHRFKHYVRAQFGNDSALHLHSLRHSTASWLVQSGSTLYEVQCLLGHTSSKTTQIYAHLRPQELHGTVNRIKIQLA
jgi:integrase